MRRFRSNPSRVLTVIAVSVGSLGLCVPTVLADQTIYENGGGAIDSAWFSFTGTATGNQFRVADDFSFPANSDGWSVSGARWTGALLDVVDGFQVTYGIEYTFDLLFFADVGGKPTGTPLDPIPGTEIAHRTVTVTGTDWGAPGGAAAEYNASFAPITFAAETTYWFTVAPSDDSFTFDEGDGVGLGWGWTAVYGTGNSLSGGTEFRDTWGIANNRQDFTMFGSPIPAPGAATLGMLGLGAIAFKRRHG